ncbi:hypothetical protein VitviT2T_026791 [Vitis vinifera]|uniref:Uncharacterized protein n=1 Tax=Vitis vinifera TaxID=29760 RepID=A0ABY9DN13_VITVI|nr:hypothetical protein VitviT2T_026791 [Vitis vinifera]
MRFECIYYSFTYESSLSIGRLVVQLADKVQVRTQRSWKRSYGVGMLVASMDEQWAHFYCNCPSGLRHSKTLQENILSWMHFLQYEKSCKEKNLRAPFAQSQCLEWGAFQYIGSGNGAQESCI